MVSAKGLPVCSGLHFVQFVIVFPNTGLVKMMLKSDAVTTGQILLEAAARAGYFGLMTRSARNNFV